MMTGYTHTKRWLSSLKVGQRILVSYQDRHGEAESDATVKTIGKKYVHVEVDENFPGHVWGKILTFDLTTGQQKNSKKGHWIHDRKLLMFTESRWRKILKRRKAYNDRLRIADAIYHRRIPDEVIEHLVHQLETFPRLPAKGKKAKKTNAA